MSLTLNCKIKIYLSKKVLVAAFIHTCLVILAGLSIQSYFQKEEEENFIKRSQEVFLNQRSVIEQEVYINMVIKETQNSNVSAIRNFVKSLDTLGFKTEVKFESCKPDSKFVINISAEPKKICFDLLIKNDFTERTSKLLYPLILIFFLTALPIYFFLIYSVKNESLLKFKSDIIDEFRHNVNSPLITLQNYIESKSSDLGPEITGELNSKISIVKGHLQASDSAKHPTVEFMDLNKELAAISQDKSIEIKSSSKNIKIEFTPFIKPALISFNRIEFISILSNLLNNSINAIENTGSISIDITYDEVNFNISISDTGRGMSPNVLPKLFIKGFTLNTVGGTGSGLYQAKYKIESQQGKILIHSQLGHGTTVNIVLPALKPKNLPTTKKKVLILEDDEILKIGYSMAIKKNQLNEILNISFFKSTSSLLDSLTKTDKDITFILDSQIGDNKIAGVELASDLKNLGYRDLYIHSSYAAQNFEGISHIKGIIKKESSNDLILFLQGLAYDIK